MDIFDFDNVKSEKTNAMLKYHCLRTVTNMFRFAEVILALVFLSYFSTRLPFVVKLSGEYFRLLISIIVKPVFVFVISNLIILALLLKSSANQAGDNADAEIFKEFVKDRDAHFDLKVRSQEDEIVYQDKQIVTESKTDSITVKCEKDEAESTAIVTNSVVAEMKNFRRTKSEKMRREPDSKTVGVLQRSETEKFRQVKNSDDKKSPGPEVELDSVDELSNEEFQRTIEAFIERQVKFHLRERFAVVPPQQQIKMDGQ